jgi:hypothetical protein
VWHGVRPTHAPWPALLLARRLYATSSYASAACIISTFKAIAPSPSCSDSEIYGYRVLPGILACIGVRAELLIDDAGRCGSMGMHERKVDDDGDEQARGHVSRPGRMYCDKERYASQATCCPNRSQTFFSSPARFTLIIISCERWSYQRRNFSGRYSFSSHLKIEIECSSR